MNDPIVSRWTTGLPPEVDGKLMEYLECQALRKVFELMHIDLVAGAGGRFFGPKREVTVGGCYRGPRIAKGEDVYGCKYRRIDHATGVYYEVIHNPLREFQSLKEIKGNYRWPVADWWDYSEISKGMRGNEELPVWGGEEDIPSTHIPNSEGIDRPTWISSEILR